MTNGFWQLFVEIELVIEQKLINSQILNISTQAFIKKIVYIC